MRIKWTTWIDLLVQAVLFPCSLSDASLAHITGYNGPLHEGENMNLSCTSTIKDRIQNVSWLFKPAKTQESRVVSNNKALFKYNMTLSDAGRYTCDIATMETHARTSITVKVLASAEELQGGNQHSQAHRNHSHIPEDIHDVQDDRLDLYNFLHLDPLYLVMGSALAALAITIVVAIYVVRRVRRKLKKDEEIAILLDDLRMT